MTDYACTEFLPFDGQRGVCARCGTALTGSKRRGSAGRNDVGPRRGDGVTACQHEWVDVIGVEHSCVRGDTQHNKHHRCGCGATLPLTPMGPRPAAVLAPVVCQPDVTL
jgi:hypothetical protein